MNDTKSFGFKIMNPKLFFVFAYLVVNNAG